MRIGVLGLVWGDWQDVDYQKVRYAAELGFHGMGAHLTVPASTIRPELAAHVREVFDQQNMPLLQIWGPYPCIISPDEEVRQAGVRGAQDIVRLAASMGIKDSGVRPTSLNPRGEWFPHPENYAQAAEDRLVRSLCEILETAEALNITIVLETHVTTTLHSAARIRKVIERTGSTRVRVNIDPCNFVGDLATAFSPQAMIREMFSTLGEFCATVHCKDYTLGEHFVVHISEAVVGTGLMDWDTLLREAYKVNPDVFVMIEHLPVPMIAQAKRNLTDTIRALNIPLG
jgi:sugar phosphate isomerase/epimerase